MRFTLTVEMPPVGHGWLDMLHVVLWDVVGAIATQGYGLPRTYESTSGARVQWRAEVK